MRAECSRMLTPALWVNIAALLALSAGQTEAAPAERPDAPKAEERVCVPPGLPPFSTWRGGPATPLIVEDEAGRPVVVIQREYEAGGRRISTFWVGELLVTVDPNPEDRSEQGWHDRGALRPDTRLRINRTSACDWFKPPPRGADET